MLPRNFIKTLISQQISLIAIGYKYSNGQERAFIYWKHIFLIKGLYIWKVTYWKSKQHQKISEKILILLG